jgi:hypothetical protein
MNATIATKTAPVIQKVMMIVSSMYRQFEAIGVHHHGLIKWKSTDATATRSNMNATAIPRSSLPERRRTRIEGRSFYNVALACFKFAIAVSLASPNQSAATSKYDTVSHQPPGSSGPAA